jgi:AcrR family transcriptional regulator
MEISKITVNKLAERATINRVTFYLHYRDIQDMLEKMAQEMVEDIEKIMTSTENASDSSDDIEWLKLLALLEYIADNAKFYKVVLGSRRTPIFTERLLNTLSDKITVRTENDSLLATKDIPKDIAIWYGSSALIGTIVKWLHRDMPYTPQFLAKRLYMLFKLGNK